MKHYYLNQDTKIVTVSALEKTDENLTLLGSSDNPNTTLMVAFFLLS